MTASIHPLAERPRHAAICGQWEYQEWGKSGGKTLSACRKAFDQAKRDSMPLTLIACTGQDEIVGMVSLWASDCPLRPDLFPWVASLYAAPQYRSLGIGAALFSRIQTEAIRLGQGRLHLMTQSPKSQAFYRADGWSLVDRIDGPGPMKDAVIMAKDL